MQNVVNLLCPFFKDRNPIINGRVYFLQPDTSAQNFYEISNLDAADYVTIRSADGTLLENPLPLDEEGKFIIQPFVDDGVDYKMVVCYPTGLPALLNDETPCWDIAYTMQSKTGEVEIHYDGIACVDSITELAQLPVSTAQAVVLGYGSKNDFCPPRIFKWTPGETRFNTGTRIRSLSNNNGAWVCEPSDFVDVRWFGVNPSGDRDYTATIIAITQDYPCIPIYFPEGTYSISNHVTAKNAIAERLAQFQPTASSTNDWILHVEGNFDDRGARFVQNTRGCVVIPKLRGTLRTSQLPDPANSALSSANLSNVDCIVFDSAVTLETNSTVTIDEKRVLVKKGVTVPAGINFGTKCNVYYEETGLITAKMMRLFDWLFKDEELAGDAHELQVSKTGGDTLFSLSLLETFIAKIVRMCSGFWLQKNPDVGEPDHVNSWEKVNGEYLLRAEHAAFYDHAATNSVVTNEVVTNLQVQKIARLDDTVTVEVDGGAITYNFNPLRNVVYQNDTVPLGTVAGMYPNAMLINVLLSGYNSTQYKLVLPHEDKDVAFYCYNPHHKKIDIQEDVTFAFVKVYGLYGLQINDDNGLSRFYIRKPSAEERTRFAIPDNVHWIIDPSVL